MLIKELTIRKKLGAEIWKTVGTLNLSQSENILYVFI